MALRPSLVFFCRINLSSASGPLLNVVALPLENVRISHALYANISVREESEKFREKWGITL